MGKEALPTFEMHGTEERHIEAAMQETHYRLHDRGSRVRFPAGAGNFSLHHSVQNGSGAHPASYPKGTGDFFLGIKRPRREDDNSPLSSAEVKNAWNYTSTPQYIFMALCLVKHRDNFTFMQETIN
jgi:hypothetical protein